jgi:hypothetical protein
VRELLKFCTSTLSSSVQNKRLKSLKSLDVSRFLLIFPLIAALVTWRGVLLWRGKVRLFSGSETIQNNSAFRVARRYQASVPCMSVAFWALIPAILLSHFSEVEINSFLRHLSEFAQWPFWLVSISFIGFAMSIQVMGGPTRLIPPSMRTSKRLD